MAAEVVAEGGAEALGRGRALALVLAEQRQRHAALDREPVPVPWLCQLPVLFNYS